MDGECILGQHELPKGKDILFTVTPRDCYGVTGATLASNEIRLDGRTLYAPELMPYYSSSGLATIRHIIVNRCL